MNDIEKGDLVANLLALVVAGVLLGKLLILWLS